MSFANFSPFLFSFAYLHNRRLPCIQATVPGERPDVFSIWQFSTRLSLQFLLLHTSCVPSLWLFSWSCHSLKGHLPRTADVSCKDLEAVLPSGCFTQESNGFFLVNSLLTALNYTEEAEEKGEGWVEKFVWKKMGKTHPFNLFRSGFLISWSMELCCWALPRAVPGPWGLQRAPWHSCHWGWSTLSASLLN